MPVLREPDVRPLSNMAAFCRQMDQEGYCVIPDVLDATQIERLRGALDRLVAEDIAAGVALDYGPNLSNRRVRCLVNRAEEFVELALNPVVLAIARHTLGYDEVQLSTVTANITGPGGDVGIGTLHADQSCIPGFFPKRLMCNTAFFLDDYTEENGATVFVPGSQKAETNPPEEMPPAAELGRMTGRAGSLAAWDGFIHHATGANRTADQRRRGIIVTFFAPFVRGQENWVRTLNPDLLVKYPPLAAITGFEEWRSLGAVWGGNTYDKKYLNY